ncbi:MAG TPA: lipopolysaccharide kinase InaA family protein [Gemmatimonadaceae bacterium]
MSTAPRRGDGQPPRGFVRFNVRDAQVVCAPHIADAMRSVLERETLHAYAAKHPRGRPMAGRGVVYAAPLPGEVESVVVRHNHHGGFFAGITRDVFPFWTRAPREVATSERLRANDVPTPVMLGYVLYEILPKVYRADVLSREVEHSFDLSAAIISGDQHLRTRALHATSELVRALVRAGAWHKDLNVKNVLLHPTVDGDLEAMVLDVDRVKFPTDDRAHDVLELNVARLLRSARKWQDTQGAPVTDAELAELVSSIRERPATPPVTAS